MSSPTTKLAYKDCEALFDQASDDAKGIRFRVPSESHAIHLRMRMQQFRALDREDNRRLYDLGNPMHGCSIYDPLVIRYRHDGSDWWVYVEPRSAPIIGDIESLSDLNEEPTLWLEQRNPLRLTSPTGTEPSDAKSDSGSNAPIESSSSTPSTPQERALVIPGLRRL